MEEGWAGLLIGGKMNSKDHPTIMSPENPELCLKNLVSPDFPDILFTDQGSHLEVRLP